MPVARKCIIGAAALGLVLLGPACSEETKKDVKDTATDLSNDATSNASELSSDASSLSSDVKTDDNSTNGN